MSNCIKKNCRFCGSKKLKKVINLGYQYIQGYFVDDNYNITSGQIGKYDREEGLRVIKFVI